MKQINIPKSPSYEEFCVMIGYYAPEKWNHVRANFIKWDLYKMIMGRKHPDYYIPNSIFSMDLIDTETQRIIE